MRTQFVTMLAAAALLAISPAIAQDTDAKDTSRKGSAERMKSEAPSTISAADRSFATKTAEDGMAEVQLGNLAKDHASNQAVKDFGNRMVTDHTKANDQLKDWASKNNVTLPTDMDAKDKAEYVAAFGHGPLALAKVAQWLAEGRAVDSRLVRGTWVHKPGPAPVGKPAGAARVLAAANPNTVLWAVDSKAGAA